MGREDRIGRNALILGEVVELLAWRFGLTRHQRGLKLSKLLRFRIVVEGRLRRQVTSARRVAGPYVRLRKMSS